MQPRPRDAYSNELLQLERPPQIPRESNPLFLASLALLRGVRPPRLQRPFICCELFAGQGLGAVMAAAVFPEAQFHVLDPAAVNIAVGRDIALQAGIDNVHFHHGGLGELKRLRMPPCDFICVHEAHTLGGGRGLRRLATFLQRTLAPGGICSVSYQALPGMQEEARLRELLRRLVEEGSGSLQQRLQEAVRQARSICAASGLLETAPRTAILLERLEKGLTPQMARDLLHPDWQPLHFQEVNDTLEAAGARHFAQAAMHYDHPPLLMSGERLEAYRPHDGTALGEYLKGMLAGQAQRYDVFHKGAPVMGSLEHGLALGELEFSLLTPRSRLLYEVNTPHGVVQLERELVDPVYNALEGGSATYGSLQQALAGAGKPSDLLPQIVAMLVDSGQLHPSMTLQEPAVRALLLDRMLLERFIVENGYAVAVTPRLGAGLQLSWETQTMRLIRHSQARDDEAAAALFLEQMDVAGRQLVQDGQPLKEPQARQERALQLWQDFRTQTEPLLGFLQGPPPREG